MTKVICFARNFTLNKPITHISNTTGNEVVHGGSSRLVAAAEVQGHITVKIELYLLVLGSPRPSACMRKWALIGRVYIWKGEKHIYI